MDIKEAMGIMHPTVKISDAAKFVISTATGLVDLCQKEEMDVELGEITIEDGVFTQWIRVKDCLDIFGVCFDREKNTYEIITRTGISNPLDENSIKRFIEEVENECYPVLGVTPHTEADCDGVYSDYLDGIY